jgi:hypothetical protein
MGTAGLRVQPGGLVRVHPVAQLHLRLLSTSTEEPWDWEYRREGMLVNRDE